MRAVATLTFMPDIGETAQQDRPDRELVQEARDGSHAAFEALVRRYSDRAFRAAYRVVRDESEAEDVLQEALIKAYRALRNFESRSSFYTWLYRIVVNLALDRRRRSKAGVSLEWDDNVARQVDARAPQPADSDPELGSMRAEVRKLVGEGIQGLPDGQREVLLLREIDGLSYEEIAETMQISKGTVMSRLHYARKKMVAFLRERGIEPGDVS
ncbi:MAG: sigma-70 family RNA polymerase sigma factor [Deltaproteobacteria bacterium]|nr:sigma-70 family RNA polymerase sigma factor [Deltaproteobacteria bacterium]MBW2413799.1 sigma-70 family RNA polymerase sigma factor [Deltaproteobacteria bacterium]